MSDWMKIGDTNPAADMEILLWHRKRGCLVGSLTYDISGNPMFANEKVSGNSDMDVSEYTHWCEIPHPTPEIS